MAAFASIEAGSVPLGRGGVSPSVYRYRPDLDPKYELLPNIRVLEIENREGPEPGAARFRYAFDSANPPSDPSAFEDALSTDSSLSGVVRNDDRLVVFASNVDGSPVALFDGFAQVPQLDLAPDDELVTFLALGVAIRAWDTPIGGALVRDAAAPSVVDDVATDLTSYFNPGGLPNASPTGADAQDAKGNQYPTFLDPHVVRVPDLRRRWTLAMAATYLCFYCNSDQTYIHNPDGGLLDSLLDSRSPRAGVVFQADDPSTYTSEPIFVPDYPATGKVWPVALHELLAPNGFGMRFRLETDQNGDPFTSLDVFRRQDGDSNTSKNLYLQPRGTTLDPTETNLAEAHFARDFSNIANSYTVESQLVRYEASFVLAPGFSISANDSTDATALRAFEKNDGGFPLTNHDRYRLYVFDETGEGHWDFDSSALVTDVPSLAPLFGQGSGGQAGYAKRRRIPIGELFTPDANQKPLKARLAISTDYSGRQPGLWDGSGTWQPVESGFELLQDRLGIWINVQNPNGWNIGSSKVAGAPYPSGVVRGVEDQSASGRTRFVLRLTCVIEGDSTVRATAEKRPSSPTSYTITRRVDARDRYAKWIRAGMSEFNPGTESVVVRDDTQSALADADARRLATESGEVAGTVTIPRFTRAYEVGDRIQAILGRGLLLRTNAGAPTEESEVYPAVVGVTWIFDGCQQTRLQLSDRRGTF